MLARLGLSCGFFAAAILYAALVRGDGVSCASAADCQAPQVCVKGLCRALSKQEHFLEISTDPALASTMFYLDGSAQGPLPWSGVISAGAHRLQVYAENYKPLLVNGFAAPAGHDVLVARLMPLSSPHGSSLDAARASVAASTSSLSPAIEIGRFFLGAQLRGEYGTAKWGDSKRRPAGSFGLGGSGGLRLFSNPFDFELGLALSYTWTTIKDWPNGLGDIELRRLNVAISPRALFALPAKRLFLAAELELGLAISNRNYFFALPRIGLSIAVNHHLELKLNPLGLDWLQDLKGKGAIIAYAADAGAAFRF